jgi:biopolymer transport protein ExbD
MRFRRSLTTRTNVDLIPLVDVVFQLVLFFMVSTTFIIAPGINLLLPSSSTSEPVAMSKLTITVISRDEIYLNKERYDINGLSSRLSKITEEERNEIRTVVIEGDEGVSYQLMVDVLDILRKNRFTGVNLRTREKGWE